MNLSGTARTVLRLAGLGLILFGIAGQLPQGWAIGSVAAGLGIFFLAGGGPC